MESEQEFQEKITTDAGRADIAKILNYQLPFELKTYSFARKAARLFKQQYIFLNGLRRVSVPTFEIDECRPLDIRYAGSSEIFLRAVNELVEKVAFKENEVLTNIVKWSSESAENGTTEGLKPIDANYNMDFERLFYPMGEAEVQPRFLIVNPVDYHRYCRKFMGELETSREKLEQGIMGYFRPGAFNQSHPATIVQSRSVEHRKPLILGGRESHDIGIEYPANYPNYAPQLDIILTERESPTLSIEGTKAGLFLRLKEAIGICVSGKYVQQVRLPEWKESYDPGWKDLKF